MPTKIHLPMSSTASGLIAYAPNWVDQSTVPHVDIPTRFVIVKDSLMTFANIINWVAFGKNSLATFSDAVRLRKAVEELNYDLYLTEYKTSVWRSAWLGEELFSALDDATYFWKTATKKSSFVESRQAQLLYKLHAAFEADPFENGMDHPAEQIIKKALQFSENQQIFNWFEDFSLDIERPSFAASVLRCLGRQTNLGTYPWRAELVRRGLTVDNVEIRDAAVQAAESWGDQNLVSILKSHHESESWLREYISDVINDLGE